MSENVILLGAGASFDAGIPLLPDFMDCMIRMAATGRSPRGDLGTEDQEILKAALKIRNKLENYHARVAVDQFDLEQILSVLSFESYAGRSYGKRDLDAFTRAIARTIELTCNVLHDGSLDKIQTAGPELYRTFWFNLFSLYAQRMPTLPTIITFNYDLVLERALFQAATGYANVRRWDEMRVRGLKIDYQIKKLGPTSFELKGAQWQDRNFHYHRGYKLVPHEDLGKKPADGYAQIRLLKLHGSLNFPSTPNPSPSWSPVVAVPDARIIPPVFNKAGSEIAAPIWRAALETLRTCRNLIVCGYSLPTTDTYMQYFLKAALGPNTELDRIYVFDPVLHEHGDRGRELMRRYSECFSRQIQSRIVFEPTIPGRTDPRPGTFRHLVESLHDLPESLLFGLLPKPKSGDHDSYAAVETVRRARHRDRFSGL